MCYKSMELDKANNACICISEYFEIELQLIESWGFKLVQQEI